MPPKPSAPVVAAKAMIVPAGKARLHRDALADPVLALARASELPAAYYDNAFDAINERQPGAYQPDEAVAEYLRAHWKDLLAEPAPAKEQRTRGRQTLLTYELIEQAADCAEDGMKDPQIYQKLGISKQLWHLWTKEVGENFQPDLIEALSQARARLAHRLLKQIPTMEKGWQALVWVLTQVFPNDFSRPNSDTTFNVNATAQAGASAEATATANNGPAKLKTLRERKRRQNEKAALRAATTKK